ncbi:MAG TPA: hypothetical protein VLG36_03120 [Candidatus Chromulinivoraceae bacterium]|nr:hypothetical protein [Candidatus Chromulinivoraceae bacterium]
MQHEHTSPQHNTQEKSPTSTELLNSLSDRFRSGETPHSLDELQELADVVNADGEEQGFSKARSYIEAGGELIMIARKKGDTPSWWEEPKVDKTCRILFDDKIVDITIPPEWQRRTLKFRSDDAPEDAIYDVTDVDVDNLPEDMKLLVDKFGPKLTRVVAMDVSSPYDVEPNSIPGVAVGLGDISKSIARQEKAEFIHAEDEAYRTEGEANLAAQRVKKGLFMSAKKLVALQDQAYKDSIQESKKRR